MRYEVALTEGNFGKTVANNHIYISSFLGALPADIIGGSTRATPAPRTIRLEHDGRFCDTDVPTTKSGKPRAFFRARAFVGALFERTGAKPGDVVVFDHVAPYHLILSLRRK